MCVITYLFCLPLDASRSALGLRFRRSWLKAQRFPAEIGPAQSAAFMIKIWWEKKTKTNICSGRQLLLTSFFIFIVWSLFYSFTKTPDTSWPLCVSNGIQTKLKYKRLLLILCCFFVFFLKKCVPHMETSLWFLFFPLTPSWSVENCWLYSQIGKNSSCVFAHVVSDVLSSVFFLFIWFCVRALRNAPSL